MKVIILGKGEMLTNLIRGCLIAGAEIVGVFRYENLFYSKFDMFLHDNLTNAPELTLIKKHKLNDIKLKSANSDEFRKEVLRLNADIILIGSWAEKLKPEIFNMPKIATINVHPSLLPRYRGPNPYLQTIWNQEEYSGVTFHLVTDKLDAGEILAQQRVDIYKGDTGKELRTRTTFQARLLCAEIIEKLESGPIEPVEQDEKEATYYPDIKPEDMTLNFLEETTEEISAHIRAFHPFRPTYIQDGNTFWIVNPYKFKITNITASPNTIVSKDKNSLTIACKDNVAIEFRELKKYIKNYI